MYAHDAFLLPRMIHNPFRARAATSTDCPALSGQGGRLIQARATTSPACPALFGSGLLAQTSQPHPGKLHIVHVIGWALRIVILEMWPLRISTDAFNKKRPCEQERRDMKPVRSRTWAKTCIFNNTYFMMSITKAGKGTTQRSNINHVMLPVCLVENMCVR